MTGQAVRGNTADEILLGFAAALRNAGVAVTADRARVFLQATACVGLGEREMTRAAGRATLCGSRDDWQLFDKVFDAWFSASDAMSVQQHRVPVQTPAVVSVLDDNSGEVGDDADRAAASDVEVLRHRDIARLSEEERERLAVMYAGLHPVAPRRRARRRRPAKHGEVDAARTLRASLQRMGEPARIRWRDQGVRARRVVLLLDVSGSMASYADAQLRLAHRILMKADRVEVFTLGTRLTHVTRALRQRDPERALLAAGQAVPDWSGGTRLGDTLKAFLDRRREMARGAVVVVISDGWERGTPDLLAVQIEHLHRLAHRVVWVNPHRGKPGYSPVQQGIAAVLPYVDDFVAGHSLAAYQELLEVIARA